VSVGAEEKPDSFVEVALPIPLRQTFTYLLPSAFRGRIKLGSRVVVPFKNRKLIGYVVAFHEDLSESDEFDLKEVIEVLDEEPMITPSILKLTQWAADYYMVSWGELLKAALPAGINFKFDKFVGITSEGIDEFLKLEVEPKTLKMKILKFLSDKADVRLKELEKSFGKRQLGKALKELEERKWINVSSKPLTVTAKPKFRKIVCIKELNEEMFESLSEEERDVVGFLQASGGRLFYTDLIAQTKASVLKNLQRKGVLDIASVEVFRSPFENLSVKSEEKEAVKLNPEQKKACKEIKEAIESGKYRTFLLHGVTGSGKTAVYVQAIKTALACGKTSLFLVPEISLTPAFSRYLHSVFADEVAILHSALSAGERFDEWRRIKLGKARVVIGTRLAVFAPLENLGLIIVDEEHDLSYRQQEMPFYNARDLAVVRAKFANAVAVLGSATPSMESFYNASTGKYAYLHLPNRVKSPHLASYELIDMRQVVKKEGRDVVISSALMKALEETLSEGKQAIIFLNRRGYSQFIVCPNCGETCRCKNCDITLTYHKQKRILLCHYCNFQMSLPSECPFCQFRQFYFVGEGTEKVEEILRARFSSYKIARIDRDVVRKRTQLEDTLEKFASGEIDILIGTQMLSKGHDFPNVALVGVISGDNVLGLPDFRAAERTFQLITQVAGRAGRAAKGRVLIQTFHPEHYVFSCGQDYLRFYQKEIEFRKRLNYPPFSVIACILVQHQDEKYALGNAMIFKECLDKAKQALHADLTVFDVAPAPISKLKGKYRFQILIRSKSRKQIHQVLELAISTVEEANCDFRTVTVEIDPISLV
jgi:primosomal protein N' (replication factor Y)